MRNVEVEGEKISVRGLKRKEVKALKKKGFDIGELKVEQVDDLLDLVFPMIFSKKEIELIEDSPYKNCTHLWTAIIAETYGSEEEEKNSPKSGAGSQTEKE